MTFMVIMGLSQGFSDSAHSERHILVRIFGMSLEIEELKINCPSQIINSFGVTSEPIHTPFAEMDLFWWSTRTGWWTLRDSRFSWGMVLRNPGLLVNSWVRWNSSSLVLSQFSVCILLNAYLPLDMQLTPVVHSARFCPLLTSRLEHVPVRCDPSVISRLAYFMQTWGRQGSFSWSKRQWHNTCVSLLSPPLHWLSLQLVRQFKELA